MNVTALIWDFDGTLVDTSPGIFRSLRAALCLCLGALALLTAALFPSLFFPAPFTLPMALALPLLLAFSAAACGCAYALAGRVRGRGLREGAAPARTKNPPA